MPSVILAIQSNSRLFSDSTIAAQTEYAVQERTVELRTCGIFYSLDKRALLQPYGAWDAQDIPRYALRGRFRTMVVVWIPGADWFGSGAEVDHRPISNALLTENGPLESKQHSMALVLPDINGFLQQVPRTQRTVTEDDPVARYFDLDAYYGDGSDDNESRSGSSSVHTPGLVYDTATSPSADSDSSAVDEQEPAEQSHPLDNTRKALEEVRKQDGHIIWPQPDPNQHLPRNTVLNLPTNKKKGRRSSSPASRQVKNPAETAQIRRLGACIKCRIEKLKCSDGGVCPSCQSKFGSPLCQHTCLRKTLAETARHATQIRYTGLRYKEEQELLKTKRAFGDGATEVVLSFFDTRECPVLPTVFRQCHTHGGNSDIIAFHRDWVPSYPSLIKWAERQILFERDVGYTAGFEGTIELFVMGYAKASATSTLPQARLMVKIHEIRCMYRIWRADTLFWHHRQSPHCLPLPPLIQAELRQIVRQALESSERDILSELDKFLKPSGISADDRAPLWAGLWQLIFVFKDMARMFNDVDKQRNFQGRAINVHPDFKTYKAATEELLIALLAFYGSHYRQASNLRVELRCLDPDHIPNPATRRELAELFKQAYLDRAPFHESVQNSSHELEQLVKALVVDHEVKRLSNRRSRGRPQTQVMVVDSSPMSIDIGLDEDVDMN
ncbi:hypothetical protein SODALDRAFT_349886 [Sodiomyces alkalinus F11]|uniref:Uncharacterized protein n=1 Tax=Sodiomyces alkalinus (strain CBS 110278 / VKM F-3762 / F11) TaxID=1314773 RepID=A0A3N2PZ95_SODAK|nr:hypothetical protein SODALDRAFT_349886 [Sodiomyces alkalinus F11]ROT39746.1 hypothetical protein SODALDRAFT_349886 [Sodiomyces alkalinus F11]